MASSQLTTTSEVEVLQARIATLEKENRELIKQNQRLVRNHKISPQSLKLTSNGDERTSKRTSVYFDGYKTRVDGGEDLEQKIQPETVSHPTKQDMWRMSSISCTINESESDASERENACIERKFGREQSILKENEVAFDESKVDRFVPIEKATEHSTVTVKKVSFRLVGSDKDDDALSESNRSFGSYLDLSNRSNGTEAEMGEFKEGSVVSAEKKSDFRMSSMLGGQYWSDLTVSSDGQKIYKFRGSGVKFALGDRKKNRYSMKVVEILQSSETPGNDEAMLEDVHSRRLVMAKSRSKSESNFAMEPLSLDWKLGKRNSKRNSCPDIFSKLGRTLSMCKMMSQRNIPAERAGVLPIIPQRRSFDQFLLLSVDPCAERTLDNLQKFADGGTTFLDPFVLKSSVDCVDKFPGFDLGDDFAPEEISSFCCDGVKIRLIPQFAPDNALHLLGWVGPSADQYKLLVFTDGNGTATHGVAVSVSSLIPNDQPGVENLIDKLHFNRSKRMYARMIQKWWRSCFESKKSAEILSKPPLQAGSKDRKRRLGRHRSSLLRSSATGGMKMMKKIGKKVTKKKKKNEVPGGNDNEDCNAHNGIHDPDEAVCEETPTPLSDKAKKLGKEAFDHMESSKAAGDSIIVEKTYVLIGGKECEQFLQLISLQHLVDIEREEHHKDHDRYDYLEMVQEKMCLEPRQARVQLPNNDLQILKQRPPPFETPALNGIDRLSIPLPLPQIAGHWGVAAILQRLQPDSLLSILNLLLIERSLLIIGSRSDVVTSCTCALLTLISPFQWASNFMPLLPQDLLDFVNSPVPFIIGMVSQSDDILLDDRVKQAMKEGLSVVDLTTGRVYLTEEAGIKSIVKKCHSSHSISKLYQYKRRLLVLRGVDSSLESFSTFLNQGLSKREIVTLHNVCSCVKGHIRKFFGDVSDKWQEYGKYTNGTFDFYPSLLTEDLRRQSESQLQLLEMMSHSQLFVEYVDERQKATASTLENCRGDVGKFIAAWIYIHWKRKSRQK